jgi:hypothetical protein
MFSPFSRMYSCALAGSSRQFDQASSRGMKARILSQNQLKGSVAEAAGSLLRRHSL